MDNELKNAIKTALISQSLNTFQLAKEALTREEFQKKEDQLIHDIYQAVIRFVTKRTEEI